MNTQSLTLHPVIVGIADDAASENLFPENAVGTRYNHINALSLSLDEARIATLRENPSVTYIDYDISFEMHYDDRLDWGVDYVDADRVWGRDDGAKNVEAGRIDGTGVSVAVIDTGVDYTHHDIAPNYRGGIDIVNDDDDPMDDNGHGTHCAGIIAAADNGLGVIGVAPGVDLYAVKVLDENGFGTLGDILAGIEWALDNDIDIVSLSIGTRSTATSLERLCERAYNENMLIVSSAGNGGGRLNSGDTTTYPSQYPSVVSVGAVNDKGERAVWGWFSGSSSGSSVELTAPGDAILSTYPDNSYAVLSGTSMACPHISGAAALVLSAHPDMSSAEVRAHLDATADDAGAYGRDREYGYGIVNAYRAACSEPGDYSVKKTPTQRDAQDASPPLMRFTPGKDATILGK